MAQGTVRSFDPQKGTGLIVTDEQEELRVHRRALAEDGLLVLHPGDVVEFRVGRDRFGRRAALDVRRIGWVEEDEDDTPREWTF